MSNNNDNFLWTDTLVKYAVGELGKKFAYPNEHKDKWEGIDKEIEKFKEQHTPVVKEKKYDDYFITAFRTTIDKKKYEPNDIYEFDKGFYVEKETGFRWSLESLVNGSNLKVYSVCRLTDGEKFTTYDETNYGIIEKFILSWVGIEVHFTNGCGATLASIEHKKEVKKPILTTEDGVDIYEGQRCWFVNGLFSIDFYDFNVITDRTADLEYFPDIYKYFSTEEKAKEYVTRIKPCLSVHDICGLWCLTPFEKEKLIDLVQQKIKL